MDDADVSRLDQAVSALAQEVAQLRDEVATLRASVAPAAAAPPRPAAAKPVEAPLRQPPIVLPDVPAAAPRRNTDLESALGQRWLLFIGAFLILCGVAFFLKIAFDRNWIGPWTRIALGIVSGAILIAGVQVRREKLPAYFADTLIGLGAGVEYVSLYSAAFVFHLMPNAEVYAAMCAVTAGIGAIAYAGKRQPLIYVALIGGYITPLLFNTDTPNMLGLFVYLSILSALAVAVAELRDWEAPPLVSLVTVTFYWLAWVADGMHAFPLAQSLPLALIVYAVFTSISLISWRRKRALGPVRLIVLAGNAFVFLSLISTIAQGERLVLATTLLGVTAAHVILFRIAAQRAQLWLAALAPVFAVPPLAYSFSNNSTVSLTLMHLGWIALGVGAAAAAARAKDQVLMSIAALIAAITALHAFAISAVDASDHFRLILNDRFISFMALAAGTFYVIRTARGSGWLQAGWQLVLRIAFDVFVLLAISPDAWRAGANVSDNMGLLAISITWALYGALLVAFGFRTDSPDRRWVGLALLGITVVKVLAFDLTGLDIALRVISALVCGVVLVVLAFIYQRRTAAAARSPQ